MFKEDITVASLHYVNTNSVHKQPWPCPSNHFETSTHPHMSIETLFSFEPASRKNMHHSWSFNIIMLEVIRTCLTLLRIIGLNSCQEMYHTRAKHCQNPSVWQYLCCFFPYLDYMLWKNMEYSFIAFVYFLCSLMVVGISVGLCQEKGFLVCLGMPSSLSLMWSEALLACK